MARRRKRRKTAKRRRKTVAKRRKTSRRRSTKYSVAMLKKMLAAAQKRVSKSRKIPKDFFEKMAQKIHARKRPTGTARSNKTAFFPHLQGFDLSKSDYLF